MSADTFLELRRILCDLLMLTEAEVAPGTLLVQDLNLDSLGFVELEFSLEERFGIKFPDVKMSPEIFGLALPESLAAIEAMPGGTTLFEFMKGEVIVAVADGAMPQALSPEAREGLLRGATVDDLARAVGGRVPPGLDGASLLIGLHIAELFRFVTAGVMARYVDFLVAQHAAATPS
jgi:acyl carrier protein